MAAENVDPNVNGAAKTTEEDIEADENGVFGAVDEPDCFGNFNKDMTKELEAVVGLPKDDLYYNMNHRNRGIAVILNHKYFSPKLKEEDREGAEVDVENLNEVLESLGFTVEIHNDFTLGEIEDVIERVRRQDHSDNDCFLLAVMTHGNRRFLCARDSRYKLDVLWSDFTNEKCPSLAGKPKMFFIQACRGKKLDKGFVLRSTACDSKSSFKLPDHPDFLIAFSSVRGFYSFRNCSEGSWFVQALCKQLTRHAYSLDLLKVLTLVNHQVAVEFESHNPEERKFHGKKQIPSISYMFTKMLRFNHKGERQ